MSKAKKKRGWIIALTALLVLMVAGGFLVYEGKKTLSQGLGSLASDGEADGDGMSIIGKYASEMKQELKDALKALKSGDLETAEEKLGSVSSKVKIVRPLVKTAITFMGRDSDTKAKLENILALVELLDTTIQELLDPAIDFMKEHPISSMKTEQGVDMKILWAYLDFGKDMMPKVETVMDLADRADLSIIDGDGSFTGKLDLVRAVLNL